MDKKLKVGILGATGMVGQKFIVLLQNHPWFEIAALAASKESAGKSYERAVAGRWKQETEIPAKIRRTKVLECKPKLDCDFVFSGLDASIAQEIERDFAAAGYPVISNAKNYRMERDVPLIIPEVNADHIKIIPFQQKRRNWKAFIVTNPNCTLTPMVMALKPIADKFGVSKINIVSMQATSGAGYPGVASLDVLDNVIPYIGGEESKVETEPLKLLGKASQSAFKQAKIKISASCNRVATTDGHLLNIFFSTKKSAKITSIKKAIQNFRGEPQKLRLPSAPKHPLVYLEDDFRPQVRYDRDRENGMTVSVGRLREDSILGFKMVALGHNTIRGAAGAAILNAELLCKKNFLKPR